MRRRRAELVSSASEENKKKEMRRVCVRRRRNGWKQADGDGHAEVRHRYRERHVKGTQREEGDTDRGGKEKKKKERISECKG